jgi:phospholipase D1/2
MHHPTHVASNAVTHAAKLLQPGLTCWRVERATRFAPIVDAAAYFAHLRNALLQARHSVLFVGWEFDTRIKLDPDHPIEGLPEELGPFLSELAGRRPSLTIRVLQWNLGLLGTLARGTTPLYLLNWMRARRFQFRLDSAHPPGASHHQKIVVIDDVLAFCGGIDMTDDRWDTREHADDDGRRVRPSGRAYAPFHDATVAVDSAAAAALGALARERWQRATGERISPPDRPNHDPWPDALVPHLRDVDVAIARTEPAYHGRPGVREIEQLYLAGIAAARHTIYIESQYFASRCIAEAMAARLSEPEGPEIVVVNPDRAMGWLEETAMGRGRSRALAHVRSADRFGRFRIYRPVTAAGRPIYVHAKVLIVDDRLLRIGSSNLNNRSMGLDTECDLAVEAVPDQVAGAETARVIVGLRDALLGEHLGVAVEDMARTLARKGSLIATIETLRQESERTLVPLDEPNPGSAYPLSESELLDPEQPEPVWRAVLHALADRRRRRAHPRRHRTEPDNGSKEGQ